MIIDFFNLILIILIIMRLILNGIILNKNLLKIIKNFTQIQNEVHILLHDIFPFEYFLFI